MDGNRLEDMGYAGKTVKVRVARSIDDLQKIATIRALVYMGEQDCPYDEEFDGNDLSGATHLIAEFGSEPAGTLRIRWFAEFAKIERLAVRGEFRLTRLGNSLVQEAIELIRRKGYRSIILHAQEHLVGFWERYGFVRRSDRKSFAFSDRAYAEMEGVYRIHSRALSINTEPLVLDRPEGEWDQPGPLDKSSVRGAQRPDDPRLAAAVRSRRNQGGLRDTPQTFSGSTEIF